MNGDRPVIGILSVFYNRTNSIGTIKQNKLLSLGDFFAYMLYNSVLDEDIKELKRLIQSVVEFTTDSIFVTDKLGKILYASKQAIRLFRRKIYSLIGSDIFQLDRLKNRLLSSPAEALRAGRGRPDAQLQKGVASREEAAARPTTKRTTSWPSQVWPPDSPSAQARP